MDGDFELNKPGWYTTQVVVENDFLDDDKFGNKWFNVKFESDASTHLWLAKEAPEEGKAYYGHIELTKSGKTTRFKREQPPEDAPRSSTSAPKPKTDQYLKDLSDYPIRLFVGCLNYAKETGLNLLNDPSDISTYIEFVRSSANELLAMSESIRSGEDWADKAKKEVDEREL